MGNKKSIKKRGSYILTSVMECNLKKVLLQPPFMLPPVIEPNRPRGDYYLSYEWTKTRIRDYILDQWKDEIESISDRTCSNLKNAWGLTHKILFDEIKEIGQDNIWLLMNTRISKKNKDNYYASIAYSLGKNEYDIKVTTHSKYVKFIDSVLTDDIQEKSIIFFADNHQSTKRKIIQTLIKHQENIARLIRVTIPLNAFENNDAESLWDWFEKKLPSYTEAAEGDNFEDESMLSEYDNVTNELRAIVSNFTMFLQRKVKEIKKNIDTTEQRLSSDEIYNLF